MKKIMAATAVILVLLVFFTVIFDDNDECTSSGSNQATPGASSVPEGSFAKPENIPPGTITSGFGARWGTQHEGLDISTGQGTPIHAYADGVVTAAGSASGFGQWIRIKHEVSGQTFETLYGHMYPQDMYVHAGDTVKAGQIIALEGSNGQSTGSHVHFEVHPGGYRNPVDPQAWVDKAVNAENVSAESTSGTKSGVGTVDKPSNAGEKLAKSTKGSEANLQINAVRGMRTTEAVFPEIKTIGGWRAIGGYADDHVEGRAIDIMIPNYQSADAIDLGNRIKNFFFANRKALDVDYIIYRQMIIEDNDATATGSLMEDRGSDTQNHMDHVHVSFNTSAMATGDEEITMIDGVEASDGYATGGCSSEDDHGDVGAPLAVGTVPAEFEPWLRRGAAECEAVDAPLLAAQLQAESGFRKGATSGAGAQGYAQFMPGTWKTWGYKVDENGNKISGPGEGDPNSVGDAVMAQARFMCALATEMEGYKASGSVSGDTTELILAGYNAGSGAVLTYGGIPPYSETQAYVKKIMDNRKAYM